MAKSRKTEVTSETKTTGPTKARATKAGSAAKKPVRRLKKQAEAATPTSPMIDTGLAAQTAARMLTSKAKLGTAGTPSASAGNRESSSFKQMKESVNKPAASLGSNALGNTFGPPKSNLPIGGQRQVVHNQTQGAGRFNVPRRTVG